MFNLVSREELLALQKKVDDLNRHLEFEKKERAADADRLTVKINAEGQQKRLEHIEAKYKAEADARAANEAAKIAEAYAEKAVAMAEKCAGDFGNAIGKALEQVTALLKEFKPVEPKLNVIPMPSGNTVELNNK